ncbi:undecaprenyldiphospho-muramoylpentapeptide beta-N-acetylglucosaminyltransferase [Ravibacter arvi]|uniref:UDP-N-acetylglucosamine--N-acetylmuramyl-(pentapeptide) pyrophosphoryl-undecaprenol N-acetylglucosamine transferase n=1 Tax=Ravibacter arvi TaxID=2051041 RepID=A0ABP8LWZ3_9BACT
MKPAATRIVISGGGTGGHIYPAIAIANALKELRPEVELLFVGALGKMEMEKVPRAGYDIIGLPVVGFQRSFSPANLLFPFKLVNSLLKARRIIRDFKPQVAVGVGGFASGPLLQMASLAGIPTLIQEQNSRAGVTNRMLAKKAAKICVAYPGMERFFPNHKIKLTGNPVRKDIINLSGKKTEGLKHFGLSENARTLFVMGGSLGARSINESLAASLPEIASSGVQVIWQTGKSFVEQARNRIAELGLQNTVKSSDFIYEMDLAYAAADVVISRAGALSVSEICLAAKPSVLVPYPFAAEDHQTSNALSLVRQNAALMVKDSEAMQLLAKTALELLADPGAQKTLSANCSKSGFPDAAHEIAKEILTLADKHPV